MHLYSTRQGPVKAVDGVSFTLEKVEILGLVGEMLSMVGLTPAADFIFRYLHEPSGGQRQRVAIARALILRPSFVVADEPMSMLDVSVRTGIMQLMLDLGEQFGISYLYITHDLAVARYMCQRIAVMYLGKIVELGETEEVLTNPSHPYTKALLSAVLDPEFRPSASPEIGPLDSASTRKAPEQASGPELLDIRGSTTAAVFPPSRCRFYDRCPITSEVCRINDHPPLEDKGAGHYVAWYRA